MQQLADDTGAAIVDLAFLNINDGLSFTSINRQLFSYRRNLDASIVCIESTSQTFDQVNCITKRRCILVRHTSQYTQVTIPDIGNQIVLEHALILAASTQNVPSDHCIELYARARNAFVDLVVGIDRSNDRMSCSTIMMLNMRTGAKLVQHDGIPAQIFLRPSDLNELKKNITNTSQVNARLRVKMRKHMQNGTKLEFIATLDARYTREHTRWHRENNDFNEFVELNNCHFDTIRLVPPPASAHAQ